MTAISAPTPAASRAGARLSALARTTAHRGLPSSQSAPIVILGGGPIGLVCALLLARQGFASRLVDARPLEALQRDRRLLALSRGTLQVLESLLGPAFAPMAPIERVQVSSHGELGSTRLGAQEFGGLAVGATIWYADLVAALGRAVAQQARILIQRPRRALNVLQSVDGVRVALDDGSQLEGALAVDAEGSPPRLREPEHFALLADLDFVHGSSADAIERFTREGPLALLPVPDPASVPVVANRAAPRSSCSTHMSMIWCLRASLARSRKDMVDAELLECVARALGPRIGAPTHIGERSVFPLITHRLRRICEHRLVHLGNAAQSLHPVAGQGFNLGIRDCVGLVESLIDAEVLERGDPLVALEKYRARRRLDRAIVPALTSALPRVFSSSVAPLAVARSSALLALDLVPVLRREFTRLLMFGAPR